MILFFAGGISDTEIQDVLSCNDDVMNKVLSPNEKIGNTSSEVIVRFPALLWFRLKYDVRDYIVVTQRDAKLLHGWKHDVFKQG